VRLCSLKKDTCKSIPLGFLLFILLLLFSQFIFIGTFIIILSMHYFQLCGSRCSTWWVGTPVTTGGELGKAGPSGRALKWTSGARIVTIRLGARIEF
jgi:hypothetical protein